MGIYHVQGLGLVLDIGFAMVAVSVVLIAAGVVFLIR